LPLQCRGMPSLLRVVLGFLVVTWISVAAALAQSSPITVLAHVTDARKQPVADLTPADLELKIEGRVHKVTSVRTAASCAVLVLLDMNLAAYYPLLTTLGALPAANNASKVFKVGLLAYNAAKAEVAPSETPAAQAVRAFYTVHSPRLRTRGKRSRPRPRSWSRRRRAVPSSSFRIEDPLVTTIRARVSSPGCSSGGLRSTC
jgi:hypothetical protein